MGPLYLLLVYYNKRILDECNMLENTEAAEAITAPYLKRLMQ
jgi:hypothetical protein